MVDAAQGRDGTDTLERVERLHFADYAVALDLDGAAGATARLLGAVLGDALGDPRRYGLDGAAVAAFLGLLWPRLHAREPVALTLACGLAATLAVPWVAPGLPIVLAAALGAAWGAWRGGHGGAP